MATRQPNGKPSLANLIEKAILAPPHSGAAALLDPVLPHRDEAERTACFHCGEPCPDRSFSTAGKVFCCQGCLVVHDLLAENGLTHFYQLNTHPGIRMSGRKLTDRWEFLDDPAVSQKLLDFTDGKMSRVTFHVPAIHCVACVWLLENLFRLRSGIGRSQVNFPKREVSITFFPEQLHLSEVASLLASLGYEPKLTLGTLDKTGPDPARKRQWLQVGVAGFAFGNIMLFSLPGYMGLDSLSGPVFRAVFGYLSLLLALPVLLYSAADYWRSAFLSFRRRMLTLDVPIALGLAALYVQSAREILTATGEGYLDSLAGLIFFLLCGRVFQQKTHERIAFDRDYKCFFPLSVTRLDGNQEQVVAISGLRVGDRLRLRNGELIPADTKLLSGDACIDYSFVTGESEPVNKEPGDYLYAGGKQTGGAIEVEILKPVSQSYLTSLWDDAAFKKSGEDYLDSLTNRYSPRFTLIVLSVALGAAVFWQLSGDGARGLKAFISVLIVACPCALALAAPFTLGTAQRLLARARVFLKNAHLVEKLARVDTILFDKTGTLTQSHQTQLRFQPATTTTAPLTSEESAALRSLAAQSTHPLSRAVAQMLGELPARTVSDFSEVPGEGLRGTVDGQRILIGSLAWLARNGISRPAPHEATTATVWVAVNQEMRGMFQVASELRPEVERLIGELSCDYQVALLSGDNQRERDRFLRLFGPHASLQFNQSPADKLTFVRQLQREGRQVMMVGDGLNDAGALKQSNVGVAVVEQVGIFSPASDVILPADEVSGLGRILKLSRQATRIVHWGFVISAAYNVIGVGIAAAGVLSPIICAVLMPTSSISVVLFACGRTHWAAKKLGVAK